MADVSATIHEEEEQQREEKIATAPTPTSRSIRDAKITAKVQLLTSTFFEAYLCDFDPQSSTWTSVIHPAFRAFYDVPLTSHPLPSEGLTLEEMLSRNKFKHQVLGFEIVEFKTSTCVARGGHRAEVFTNSRLRWPIRDPSVRGKGRRGDELKPMLSAVACLEFVEGEEEGREEEWKCVRLWSMLASPVACR